MRAAAGLRSGPSPGVQTSSPVEQAALHTSSGYARLPASGSRGRAEIRSGRARAERPCDWSPGRRSSPAETRRCDPARCSGSIPGTSESRPPRTSFRKPRRDQFLLARLQVQPEGPIGQLPDLLELLRQPVAGPASSLRQITRPCHESFTLRAGPDRGSARRGRRPEWRRRRLPVTFLKVSPRLLITTSCLPISSSTSKQKRCPSTSATTSTACQRIFGLRSSRETGGKAAPPAAALRAPEPSRPLLHRPDGFRGGTEHLAHRKQRHDVALLPDPHHQAVDDRQRERQFQKERGALAQRASGSRSGRGASRCAAAPRPCRRRGRRRWSPARRW